MYVFFLSLHIQITSILLIQFYTSKLKLCMVVFMLADEIKVCFLFAAWL